MTMKSILDLQKRRGMPKTSTSKFNMPEKHAFLAVCKLHGLTKPESEQLLEKYTTSLAVLEKIRSGLIARGTSKSNAARLRAYVDDCKTIGRFVRRYDTLGTDPLDFEVIDPPGLEVFEIVAADFLAPALTAEWLMSLQKRTIDRTTSDDEVHEFIRGRSGLVVAELLFLVSRILKVTAGCLEKINETGKASNQIEHSALAMLNQCYAELGRTPSRNKTSKYSAFVRDVFETIGLNPQKVDGQIEKVPKSVKKASKQSA